MILIFTYGAWGSELYSTADSLEEAVAMAEKASGEDPKNEYCVELDPGAYENPLFKNGVRIQG